MQNLLNWDLATTGSGGKGIIKMLVCSGILVILAIAGCEQASMLGSNDKKASREVALEDYRSVWTYGLFDISLVQDTVHKAVIKGRRSMVENIHFKHEDGRITVTEGKSNYWQPEADKPRVTFHFDNLNYFRIEEPSSLTSPDTIHTSRLEVIVANELSRVDLKLDVGYFYLENWTTSTGRFRLEGQCHQLEVKLCGSGVLKADKLAADKAFIRQKSIGDGYVRVSDTLKVHSTGSGDVYYYGSPGQVLFQKQSSGQLIGL
jgi:hypothetical protein